MELLENFIVFYAEKGSSGGTCLCCTMGVHCLGPMNPEGMAQHCAGSQSRPTGWKMMFAWLDCVCIHTEENSCLQLYENPSSRFDICSHLKLSFSNKGNRYFTISVESNTGAQIHPRLYWVYNERYFPVVAFAFFMTALYWWLTILLKSASAPRSSSFFVIFNWNSQFAEVHITSSLSAWLYTLCN